MTAPITSNVEQHVPYRRRVFCNRNLRLDQIRVVGFDMDYTLALYSVDMEHLQAEMVLERLVASFGYPRAILHLSYDPGFAVRGLTVDLEHGNVFKMDSHRFVGKVWHGAAPLDPELRRQIYTNRKIVPADPKLVMVDTLFSLPEISLYCQLVGYFDALPAEASRPTYSRLWTDLRNAMDSLHRDGTLKERIVADLGRYLREDDELAETLHRLRSSGKRLFILTNSEATYTEAVMSRLLDERYPGYQRWIDFFDFVITFGDKPSFFVSREPFLRLGPGFEPLDEPVTALRRGEIYQGGNLQELMRLAGLQGDEVLYVGDHIYGDILRSKRATTWRTAMIVPEMDEELEKIRQRAVDLDRLDELEALRFQQNLERAARAVGGEGRDRELDARVRELTREIAALDSAIAEVFNPFWGMIFRDRAELSAFGAQVEDYACLYTGRVSNFRLYSPLWYFRSPRDRMAHELGY